MIFEDLEPGSLIKGRNCKAGTNSTREIIALSRSWVEYRIVDLPGASELGRLMVNRRYKSRLADFLSWAIEDVTPGCRLLGQEGTQEAS